MPDSHTVKSTERTFEIIEELVEGDGSTLSGLADRTGMAKSTVFDHLATLQKLGYVSAEDNVYTPTLRFLQLGGRIRFQRDIYHVARPKLQELTEETGEPCTLVVQEGDYAISMFNTMGEYTTRSIEYDGSHIWLHANAPGKVFLAHSSQERVESLVDRYGLPASTERTITDPSELYDELDEVREQGYAVDVEEGVLGMQGIAKPIHTERGEVVAAVTVYGATRRLDIDEFVDEMLKPLTQTASVIEINMSYDT